MPSIFHDSCLLIHAAYEELGHELGWRFLTSPEATLRPATEIALITLNPGGDGKRPDHGRESSEPGSAYIVESWGNSHPPGEAPLQIQIRSLFKMIAQVRDLEITGDELLGQSLSAQFVPFRSPSLSALERRQESFVFARDLWSRLFEHISPLLVITIDKHTHKRLLPLLSTKWGEPTSAEITSTGWGNASAELVRWESSTPARALIRLPHLSTFKLFSRDACIPHMESLLAAAVECCWGQP